jgi:hypothetical protein
MTEDREHFDTQIERIADAMRDMVHGGTYGPLGMESLAMALTDGFKDGAGGHHPGVADSLLRVAEAIDRLADAVESKD